MEHTFDKTTVMDSADQMREVASSAFPIILECFTTHAATESAGPTFATLTSFQARVASRATELHSLLRKEFLTGVRGAAPASSLLGKTKGIYEFVRMTIGVKMHGDENFAQFPNGLGIDNVSIGQNISKVYEVGFPNSFDISLSGN